VSIKNKQTSLTVRIDQEQMDWLDKVSIEDRRTRSELVRMILDFCMANIETPRELIEGSR
jgi:metal-responsive CopG/Arc/MetJ family transcriptional regulator